MHYIIVIKLKRGSKMKEESKNLKSKEKIWKWDTNSISAKISKKGLILENWNCNQCMISGRKILLLGTTALPSDNNIEQYINIIRAAYEVKNKYNIKILRWGARVL